MEMTVSESLLFGVCCFYSALLFVAIAYMMFAFIEDLINDFRKKK